MIPKDKLERDHVISALKEIDESGVPEMHHAKGFDLVYEGKLYPPKWVFALAFKYARGTPLSTSEFSGGEPTNAVLRSLGFEVRAREHQSLRDGFEAVMAGYVTARTKPEQFGTDHPLWGKFVELR